MAREPVVAGCLWSASDKPYRRLTGSALALALILLATSAQAGNWWEGYPLAKDTSITVVDGDTLLYRGVKLRLIGLDAFELDQVCRERRRGLGFIDQPCGVDSKNLLTYLTRQHSDRLRCEWDPLLPDPYGHYIAICSLHFSNGKEVDLGALMVSACMAMPWGEESPYTDLFRDVMASGLRYCHRDYDLIEPWEWRRGMRYGN